MGGNTPTRIGPFDVALSQGQEATGWVVGGIGWYRKHFRLTPQNQNAQAEIRFDGVYMNSEVWINGHSLGSHPYGYTSFVYDLTPFLKRDGENVLAVKVRNEGENSRWYSGSGIYRHVWLTLTGDVRIPMWGVGVNTPEVSRELSKIEVSVAVENRGNQQQSVSIRTRILGPGGTVAASGDKATDLAAGDRQCNPEFRSEGCRAVVARGAQPVSGRDRCSGCRQSGGSIDIVVRHSQHRSRCRAWAAHQR